MCMHCDDNPEDRPYDCICNTDQGAGYTFNDEHGPCDACILRPWRDTMTKKQLRKEIKELQERLRTCYAGEVATLCDEIERLRRQLIDKVIGI